jgi:exopolysaccharide biosynthesis polyprenyl glycosylphosphotransferase
MHLNTASTIDSTGTDWSTSLTLPDLGTSVQPPTAIREKQREQGLATLAEPVTAPAFTGDRRKPISIDAAKQQTTQPLQLTSKAQGVLIVGTGPVAQEVRKYLTSLPRTHYDFRGFAGTAQQIFQTRASDAERIGNAQDLIALARSRFVDEIIFIIRPTPELESELLIEAAPHHINIRFIPDVADTLRAPHSIRYIGALPTVLMHQPMRRPLSTFMKRTMDVALVSIGLLLLAPLFALIAIAVRLDSAGPVFYASPRIGKKGQLIYCHKFRTMVPNAAALLASVAHLNERDGVFFKIKKDPRITRVGAILRKYSLDELPQLWNVLRGDMSLVGPRPCIPTDVSQYKTPCYLRHDVLPGLTGLWQVEARNDPSFDRYIELDNKYVSQWSVWLDLKLIFRTFRVVLMGTGV